MVGKGAGENDRCNKCNTLPITPISLIPPITLILFFGDSNGAAEAEIPLKK